jgi:hypothetical protein
MASSGRPLIGGRTIVSRGPYSCAPLLQVLYTYKLITELDSQMVVI